MKRMFCALVLALAITSADAHETKPGYAIVLQAGAETNEGKARAVHALLYARELAEKGYPVVLVFDGAGTGWASELRKPENPLHKHYAALHQLGVVEEICDYCAEQFAIKADLPEQQRKRLVGDYEGHPSLVRLIEKGYHIIVL